MTSPPPQPEPGSTAQPAKRPPQLWWAWTGVIAVACLIGGAIVGTVVAEQSDEPVASSSQGNTAAELDEQEQALDERDAELVARAASLTAREQALIPAEAAAAKDVIPGDGTWHVGVDINPGTYKVTAVSECYWSINADPNGSDILENNISSGPQTVVVEAGQFFEVSRCGEWNRVP